MPRSKYVTNSKTTRLLGQGPRAVGSIIGILGTACLLLLWLVVSWYGWVKPLYLPPPWRVVQAAFDIRPHILVHTFYTGSLVVVGLSLGTLLGFIVGLAIRHNFVARSVITPIVESWRHVPAVALIPFFILWFGFSWEGKIILIVLGTFLIVVIGVANSIDRLDPVYLRVALSFGGNNWKFLRHAALSAIMPAMLAPLRITLAVSITLAVVSEYMGATRGLGHVINIALNNFSSHTILLCAIILGILGGCFDWGLRTAHTRLVKWAKSVEEGVQLLPDQYKETDHEPS